MLLVGFAILKYTESLNNKETLFIVLEESIQWLTAKIPPTVLF